MLPTAPGIYAWMLDLRRAFERAPGGDGDLVAALRAAVRPDTPRVFEGEVPPYTAVSLYDAPRNLTARAEANIDSLSSLGAETAEWALLCPTMLQRPLYIGKAKNLRRRLRDHLLGKTALVGYLREVGLTLNDCAVLVSEVTPAPATPDLEDDDDTEDDWYDLEPESLEGLDPATVALISAAESLTIRLSRPLLNRKMD